VLEDAVLYGVAVSAGCIEMKGFGLIETRIIVMSHTANTFFP
jgi:hypothetical protein